MGKKQSIDRLLMIALNILLAIIVAGGGYGLKEIISNQKVANAKQELTTQAINELKIVLTMHNGRITNNEDDILDLKVDVDNTKKRVNVLEDIIK